MASIGVVATPPPSSKQSRPRPQHSAPPDQRPTNPSAILPRTQPPSDDSQSSDEHPFASSSATSISTSPESQPVLPGDAKHKTLQRSQFPPNQCRDWVRGRCLRPACKFLHGSNEVCAQNAQNFAILFALGCGSDSHSNHAIRPSFCSAPS